MEQNSGAVLYIEAIRLDRKRGLGGTILGRPICIIRVGLYPLLLGMDGGKTFSSPSSSDPFHSHLSPPPLSLSLLSLPPLLPPPARSMRERIRPPFLWRRRRGGGNSSRRTNIIMSTTEKTHIFCEISGEQEKKRSDLTATIMAFCV